MAVRSFGNRSGMEVTPRHSALSSPEIPAKRKK